MIDMTRGDTALIRAAAEAAGASLPQMAYLLATAWWETNRTMRPVREAYYLGDRAEAYRRSLRYFPWYGRGYVQLTWETNYRRAGAAVGADLIADPDLAMAPQIAARVLVTGSLEGWFTGKRLGDYVAAGRRDFVNARRVINGLDCAAEIARIADEFEDALAPDPGHPVLRRGSRGAAVRELQRALIASGRDLVTDGVFGPGTEAAVRQYQSAAGLAADGVVGPVTWAALLQS